jgi:hypothetical protein
MFGNDIVFQADEIGLPDVSGGDAMSTAEVMESVNMDRFADGQTRANAMGIVLTWIDEGDYSYDALESLVTGDADFDDDGDVDESDEAYYNDLWDSVANTIAYMGVDAETVQDFIDNENNKAGMKIGAYLSDRMDGEETDDDELITRHAVGSAVMESANLVPFSDYRMDADADEMVLESYKKVVRGGKVTLKKKRIKRPKKMSAKQKQALKKARRKSNKGAAKRKRAKSMRTRKKRGM